MNTFYIKECYDDRDLRTLSAQSKFLREEAKKHNLKHGCCIVYTNTALTRFRMILKIHDAVLLCIPEIDMASKRTVYLHISEELARLAGREARITFSKIQKITAARIQNRKERERKKSEREQSAPR